MLVIINVRPWRAIETLRAINIEDKYYSFYGPDIATVIADALISLVIVHLPHNLSQIVARDSNHLGRVEGCVPMLNVPVIGLKISRRNHVQQLLNLSQERALF